ncbi:MAG: ribosome silencing factor [Puniceicoccales bacterium]|jgi:ribosome-associated protein|nr:ribosome silencing factor [Puniceicoccales bacterium]
MNHDVKEFFPETLKICHRIITDKKCSDLKIFTLEKEWKIADYVILATATSEPHLRAIGEELCQTFKHQYGLAYKVDYKPLSGWMVFDAFDVILHALTATTRREYRLDKLFESSTVLNWSDNLSIDIGGKSSMSED